MESLTRQSLQYLDDVLESLIYGRVELHDVPREVAALYYLGEAAHVSGVLNLRWELEQAQADADRLYGVCARGGFGVPIIKSQGRTFAELQALRRLA